MGDLQVPTGQIPAQASSTMAYVGNLSSDWTPPAVAVFDHTDPQTYNSSTVSVVYDSLGAQHSMTQYFVRSGGSQVTVHYTLDGVDAATTNVMDFGPNGQLTAVNGAAPAPAALALGTPTGALPLAVNIDYAGTTQFAGAANTTTNRADGYASGTFTGVSINDDGAVMATYSNGQKQSVGTLAVATFPDEGALVAVSDTSWTTSNASGQPLYFAPGTGMGRRPDHRRAGAVERRHHVGARQPDDIAAQLPGELEGHLDRERDAAGADAGGLRPQEMDALIYTAMSGAERALHAQQVHANNLANLETGGFRADLELATSHAVPGFGYDARHFGELQANSMSTKSGALRQTERELDGRDRGRRLPRRAVAGGEGVYPRRRDHRLRHRRLSVNGLPLMGTTALIVLPRSPQLAVAADGTISVQTPGSTRCNPSTGLKLVKPDAENLTKNVAGLVVTRTGEPAPVDETVAVRSGHLEGSNVSAVEEMVATMDLNAASRCR
jgi:flagellar basal body rod protein FlgF